MTKDQALVRETKALISEVEAGETDHAAWIAIQDRVKQLGGGRTQRGVGELLAKDHSWVRDVLRWNRKTGTTPFSAKARGRDHDRNLRGAKKALRDPGIRRQVIDDLTPSERSEVVREITRSTTHEPAGDEGVELPDLDEAVAADLTAQVAKLVHTASRIDVLLAEHDAIFKRIDADKAARLDDELERAVKTIRTVRAELLKHREIEVQA